MTDSIAGRLGDIGLAKGSRVSVFTKDPLVSTLWMVGLWKAGVLYCPVNHLYEGALLAHQIADTEPELIVVDPELVSAISDVLVDLPRTTPVVVHGPGETLLPNSLDYGWFLKGGRRPAIEIGRADLANIIYTSGTTGPSKGVLQSHLWMNQFTWASRVITSSDDVIYNDLPMYHVAGAFHNVAKALWMGGSVWLWNKFSPSAFWSRVEESGATTAVLLDVMAGWLWQAPERPTDHENSLNKVYMQPVSLNHHEFAQRFSIEYILAGFGQTEAGNPLMTVIDELEGLSGIPARCRSGLGRTEIQARSAEHGLQLVSPAEVKRKAFMGYPTFFVDVEIQDADGMPVTPGAPGELSVRQRESHVIFEGYYNNVEASANAYLNGWFRTGDAAMIDPVTGHHYFVDRMRDRIRVRGENVSTFHVEEVIQQHPDVELCAIFPFSEGGADDEIVAVVQARKGAALSESDLRCHLDGALPKFMRPQHIIIEAEIPRTPTNKIKKYELRQRFEASRTVASTSDTSSSVERAQR